MQFTRAYFTRDFFPAGSWQGKWARRGKPRSQEQIMGREQATSAEVSGSMGRPMGDLRRRPPVSTISSGSELESGEGVEDIAAEEYRTMEMLLDLRPFPGCPESYDPREIACGIVVVDPPIGSALVPVGLPPLDVQERQERIESGQCPNCGQLLFTKQLVRGRRGSGLFRRKKKQKPQKQTQEHSSQRGHEQQPLSGSATAPSAPNTSPNEGYTMVPLTVPGSVERGQCLRCCSSPSTAIGHSPACDSNSLLGSSSNSLDAMSDLQHRHKSPAFVDTCAGAGSVANVSDDSFSDSPATSCCGPSCWDVVDDAVSVAQPTAGAVAPGNVPVAQATPTSPAFTPSTAHYAGPFNEYGERHGHGIVTWSNGDRYEGEFFNGVRHGDGSLFFADGSEYVGEWECNYMHGHGTRRFPNGDVYVGGYRDGKRSGPDGRFYFANGDLYVGSWSDDLMNGIGRYYYSNGQRFEGRFRDGKRHGPGKFQRVDGSLDQFLYLNDRRSGVGIHWSRQRTRAWRCDVNGNLKKKLTMEDAMTLAFEIDKTEC